jgi:hypothetical protein
MGGTASHCGGREWQSLPKSGVIQLNREAHMDAYAANPCKILRGGFAKPDLLK